MIEDKFGEKLNKGDTVAFLDGKLMVIAKVSFIKGYSIQVTDEQDTSSTYNMKSRSVVKLSGDWKIKAGEE